MVGDDLSRNLYCILGVPIDVGDMQTMLSDIETAVAKRLNAF
jgi:hypothetical protein